MNNGWTEQKLKCLLRMKMKHNQRRVGQKSARTRWVSVEECVHPCRAHTLGGGPTPHTQLYLCILRKRRVRLGFLCLFNSQAWNWSCFNSDEGCWCMFDFRWHLKYGKSNQLLCPFQCLHGVRRAEVQSRNMKRLRNCQLFVSPLRSIYLQKQTLFPPVVLHNVCFQVTFKHMLSASTQTDLSRSFFHFSCLHVFHWSEIIKTPLKVF